MRDYLKRHGGEDKKRFTAAELQAFNQHGWHCHYCGIEGPLTADHIIPRIHGGGDESENLIPACRTCNSSRGTKDFLDFKEHIHMDMICFALSEMVEW